jgi:hypothetical protein
VAVYENEKFLLVAVDSQRTDKETAPHRHLKESTERAAEEANVRIPTLFDFIF